MGGRGALSALVLVALAVARPARADPSDRTLVLVGLAMAPPTYLLGVTWHEGSHAIAAKLVGASVDELHLFPPGVDPHVHKFRFGWTYVHGLDTRGERVFFYVAPKLTDLLLLGGFAALVYTSAWPGNRYAQLALTVGATGAWVDFAKDVVLFSPYNDVSLAMSNACLTGWRQVPVRLLYAAADVGLALVVARGYERTFQRAPASTALVLPVFSASF